MYSRSYGFASDNVLNFTVATHDGTIVRASLDTNADLYWALRGVGGGNFGYVLEMTHRIHRINATEMPNGQYSFINITWINTDAKVALLNWLTFLKDTVSFPVVNRKHVLSAMATNVTEAMLEVILNFQPNRTMNIGSWTEFIYLNKATKDSNTAYAFPDASFDFATGVGWQNPDYDSYAIGMSEAFFQKLIHAATPTNSIVGAYLNYIDPYLPNWQTMYYRHHWDRLREIQIKWDPNWYFRFPQGIPPTKNGSVQITVRSSSMIYLILPFLLLLLEQQLK